MALGLLTSGGDAPGMNTAVAYLTRFADARGLAVVGLRGGFQGLLERKSVALDPAATWTRARHGGTLLGSSRLPEFGNHVDELRRALAELEVDKLVVLGGNGSLRAAAHLVSDACAVVGIPATIDNDIEGSDESIGFNTAVDTGVRTLDGITDAAEAMGHLFALEVLGGGSGALAAAVAEAGGADAVLLPGQTLDEAALLGTLGEAMARRGYAILVTPEYYPEVEALVARLSAAFERTPRFGRIGHAQRGGAPNARDRLLARRLAGLALETLAAGESGRVLWRQGEAILEPYGAA